MVSFSSFENFLCQVDFCMCSLSHTWALMLVVAFHTCALGSHGRTQEVSNLFFCLLAGSRVLVDS